jgi:hypothetical protein
MHVRTIKLAALRLVTVMGLALGLQACAQSQDTLDSFQNAVHEFNPFGTAKKPLPGDRKALFPEGVPGVQQGVPPELVRGNQQPEVITAPEPAVAPKPERKKARPTRAAKAEGEPPPQRPQRARRRGAPQEAEPPPDGVWPPPQQSAPPPRAATTSRPAPQSGQEPVPTIWPDPPKSQ